MQDLVPLSTIRVLVCSLLLTSLLFVVIKFLATLPPNRTGFRWSFTCTIQLDLNPFPLKPVEKSMEMEESASSPSSYRVLSSNVVNLSVWILPTKTILRDLDYCYS